MQPLVAFSEYTPPPGLPTNTRPPTMVACAFDCRSPGKPNAHFSFSLGMSAGARPALRESVNRVFDVLAPPQPFHAGPEDALNFADADAGFAAEHMAFGSGVISSVLRSCLPVTASAIARRSAALRPVIIEIIGPVSRAARTRSADIARSVSMSGARFTPPMWHCAQIC